jgi:hypothetical protein
MSAGMFGLSGFAERSRWNAEQLAQGVLVFAKTVLG